MGHVHTGSGSGIRHDLTERIVPHLAHHGHVGAQAGTLDRLIGALSPRRGLELQADDGLAGIGGALGGGDQIHHKAAHHQNIWLFQHVRAPPLVLILLSEDCITISEKLQGDPGNSVGDLRAWGHRPPSAF